MKSKIWDSKLRVFLSIFDLTLEIHFFRTVDGSPNPFLPLRHLTPTVYSDSISSDISPSSGGNESIKIETLNAIGSCHDYPIETKLVPFDCKLNFLSKMDFFTMIPPTILSKFTVRLVQFAYKYFNRYFLTFYSTFDHEKSMKSKVCFYSLE